ncbi:McrB family protein [Kitasatospora kifunensis]|uniref:5-methylcytosine-specific restriction protein B n=1 Tax=Kitasatospora kifunensis TaxID=58351 RepID=A0A7W7RBN3_KITKI|nr:AAA family ATPase [Kitasatospora kifunensis]MBB4928997.1 5-methylcytosine-specific restriction protein B [Kitasatospora kifunensis]
MQTGVDGADDLARRIAQFDRAAVAEKLARAEDDRRRVLAEFPLDDWRTLPLERYALGPAANRLAGRSFCRLMEYGTDSFGSMRGGSAAKHIIYQHRSGEWRYPTGLGNPGQAWQRIRADFVAAFGAAGEGQFKRIDDCETLSFGQALVTKALAVYFPDEFLPVFSAPHVRHFVELLGGRSHRAYAGVRTWQANRELLQLIGEHEEFAGWQPREVMTFLYAAYDPRPKHRDVWKIAPGDQAKLWEDCRAGSHICVGWDELGDLGQYESDLELKSAMDDFWPQSSGGNLQVARQLIAFRDLEEGDLVVANRGKSEVLALGRVSGGYRFEEDRAEFRHLVGVEWDESYAQTFTEPVHAWQRTFAKVPDRLLRRIREGRTEQPAALLAAAPPQPVEVPAAVSRVLEALQRKGQVILQGPPGTGKTRLAMSAALALAEQETLIEASGPERRAALAALLEVPAGATAAPVTMVTFHPSYGYEDFVEGYKPDTASDQAGLKLALKPGLFLRLCQEAAKAPEQTFLLIIDEINRGDLPRILGELVTLLELDKRDIPVSLPTSGKPVAVPANVRIIGTMNTADRSVGHLDVAIRRRFAFIDVPPDLDAITGNVDGLDLSGFLQSLNSRLDKAFGPDHQIGQACLLQDDEPLGTVEELSAAFHHDIVPLIDDHCLGRPELLREVLGALVDAQTGRIAQINPQDLPAKLAAEFVAADQDDELDG